MIAKATSSITSNGNSCRRFVLNRAVIVSERKPLHWSKTDYIGIQSHTRSWITLINYCLHWLNVVLVWVRVKAAQCCHTDLHAWRWSREFWRRGRHIQQSRILANSCAQQSSSLLPQCWTTHLENKHISLNTVISNPQSQHHHKHTRLNTESSKQHCSVQTH